MIEPLGSIASTRHYWGVGRDVAWVETERRNLSEENNWMAVPIKKCEKWGFMWYVTHEKVVCYCMLLCFRPVSSWKNGRFLEIECVHYGM
jgi:hypothetical protein